MSRIRVLSGKDIIKILESFGFIIIGQKGSHVKMKRVTKGGSPQTLTIPKHSELDKGTIKAIYIQILRYLSEDEIKGYFYSE